MLCKEGPDLSVKLCNANLQDQAVFAMWSLKVSWSSKITPRFLTELEGVIVDFQQERQIWTRLNIEHFSILN